MKFYSYKIFKKNILQMKCYDDVGGFPATKNVFPLGLNLFLARSALFLSLLLTTSIQEQKIIRLTFNYMCIYKKRNQNMYIYHFLRGWNISGNKGNVKLKESYKYIEGKVKKYLKIKERSIKKCSKILGNWGMIYNLGPIA